MARGLGKGLEGLFEDNLTFDGSSSENGLRTVRISLIEPNKAQPRKAFDKEKIDELSLSIKENGVLQPLIVRELNNGRYQIISGERRWRASRQAGLEEIPVIVKELSDQQVLEIGLIENLQREDLNAVEEAHGYRTLMSEFGLTQEQVAESVGKSRSAVTNTLRLLSLKEDELEALSAGKITAGHARALLSAEGEQRKEMFKAALAGASVRELERMAKQKPAAATYREVKTKKPFYSEVELSLRSELGRKVNIKPSGKKGGTITLEFFSDDELADIARKLSE